MSAETDYPRLGRSSLRTEVLNVIRNAILVGKLKPGERIAESKLARQMDISRAPIREALNWLERDGLVRSVASRGYLVVDLLEEEVDQAYQLRALLEGFAVRKAVQLATSAGIDKLQMCIRGMAAAVEEGNVESLIEHDIRFHHEIISLSSYSLLPPIWSGLDRMIRLRTAQVLRQSPRRDILPYTVDSHYPILDAFVRRNPIVGEEAVKNHISEVRLLLLGEEDQARLHAKQST